jgi:hypothetical protein
MSSNAPPRWLIGVICRLPEAWLAVPAVRELRE